jgi:hypothetical protein
MTGRLFRWACAMAFATARNVLTARISGRPAQNFVNDPPAFQGAAKSDTCTRLWRFFSG